MSYLSTLHIAEMYDVDKTFFTRKMDDEFKQNVHFVRKKNTLRWNVDAVRLWWFGEDEQTNSNIDDILNKVL